MKKAQGAIVGTVLISSIIIGIVSVSYLWGKPLIDKSTDKVRINSLISIMKNIEGSIESVTQGGSRTINLGLESNEEFRVESNKITLITHTSVPIITTLNWAPLNTYELPFRENLYRANTNKSCNTTNAGCVCEDEPGYNDNVTFNTINISNTSYTVCNYNGSEGYNYTCINNSLSECGGEESKIRWLGIEIINKNETILSGNETNISGTLGEDTSGILMAKTTPTGNKQEVRFRIRFRPLINKQGRKFIINPTCEDNCVVRGGDHRIEIRKKKTDKKVNSTITKVYLNID